MNNEAVALAMRNMAMTLRVQADMLEMLAEKLSDGGASLDKRISSFPRISPRDNTAAPTLIPTTKPPVGTIRWDGPMRD